MEFSPLCISFFRVSFTCLALRLKVSHLGIIPKISTFTVSALMFLAILMFFAMVSGSSLDGKLLVPQSRIICFGESFMVGLM